ncbi:MAG: putative capsid protein [Cressdnaviricota sp.]|nr:MAG: putative capsid protein [Cressdnaviricota sp.]
MPYVPYRRKRTYRGKPVRRSRPPYRKPAVRRSYAPSAKKAMVAARSPIVETKSFEAPLVASVNLTNGNNVVLPLAYLQMEPGFLEKQMIGNTLFSKFITQKTALDLTASFNSPTNFQIWYYAGWCKAPINSTINTIPMTSQVAITDIVTWVEDQLLEAFTDPMDFGERQQKIKFVKKKRVHYQPALAVNEDISDNPLPKVLYHTTTWKPNRKIHYAQGTTNTALSQSSTFFPNREWIPFVCYRCENLDTTSGSTFIPSITQISKHWFSDS